VVARAFVKLTRSSIVTCRKFAANEARLEDRERRPGTAPVPFGDAGDQALRSGILALSI
jgi:hypothetical protein